MAQECHEGKICCYPSFFSLVHLKIHFLLTSFKAGCDELKMLDYSMDHLASGVEVVGSMDTIGAPLSAQSTDTLSVAETRGIVAVVSPESGGRGDYLKKPSSPKGGKYGSEPKKNLTPVWQLPPSNDADSCPVDLELTFLSQESVKMNLYDPTCNVVENCILPTQVYEEMKLEINEILMSQEGNPGFQSPKLSLSPPVKMFRLTCAYLI